MVSSIQKMTMPMVTMHLTADDCDDFDPESTIVANDLDCDGLINTEDDNADGDNALNIDDCDDLDPESNIKATDFDCDGFLTDDDCDDSNADLNTELSGLSSGCAAETCQDIKDLGYTSGGYWLQSDVAESINVYCEMDVDDVAWIDVIASLYAGCGYRCAIGFVFQVTNSVIHLNLHQQRVLRVGLMGSTSPLMVQVHTLMASICSLKMFHTHVKAKYFIAGIQ